MNCNAFIHIFFILLKFSYSTSSEQCSKSISFWSSLKYPYMNMLKNYKLQTTPLKCPLLSTSTCCNSDILKEMSSISEIKLKRFAEEKIEFLLMLFSNDSYVLMNLFINDLENTKNDLNQLFSATYGYNYKVEKNFFYSWFDKLKSYMEGKLHNIGQLLDNFFLEMAEKIVKILIPPESGPEVTKCQIARLIEAKPYQNTDINLKSKIIRSYPPARLLVNAIAVGRDAFKKLMKKTTPSVNCLEQFNTQFHCMLCNGLTVKSCPMTCKSVMDNCFGSFKSAELKKLDKVLNKYIKAIIDLASKLDNPFNFPTVNHKMNVQISTAIMNVQNTYPNIKDQIKAKCQKDGGNKIKRKKRQVSPEFLNWQANSNGQPPLWEQKPNGNMKSGVPNNNRVNSQGSKLNDFLSPIVRTIKTEYKTLEKYFQKIVPDFCTKNSDTLESVQCWNGTSATQSEVSLEKNNKKKIDKTSLSILKTVINQIKDITTKINLLDKTPDPETIPVEEFTLYKSKQENKLTERIQRTSQSPVEGSGDFEKFPIDPIMPPKKPEPEIVKPPTMFKKNPLETDQTNKKVLEKLPKNSPWEGSGDVESRKRDPDESKSLKQLPINPSEKKSSTPSPRNISTFSVEKIMIQSSTESNLNTDDEDMVSKPPKGVPDKSLATGTLKPMIVPEGSGLDPDITPRKPKQPNVEQLVTTKKPVLPEKPIEGSGLEVEKSVEKPRPVLPMLPGSSEITTRPPKKKDPHLNPDEEKVIEGSGRKADFNLPIPSKPQTITDTTLSPTKPLQPDQYPGKIPAEVWIPGVDGVKNTDKDNQKTTPGNQANTNQRSTITTITTLSLLLIYCLT